MNQSRISALAVALAMMFSGTPASAAPASGEQDVRLDVEVDAGLEDAALIDTWVTDQTKALLDERGIASGATPRKLQVRIGGQDLDYTIDVAVTEAGTPIEPAAPTVQCKCSYKELQAASLRAVEPLLPRLEPDQAPPPTDAALDHTPTPSTADAPRRGLGKAGAAGVALLVIGTLGTGAGIGLLVAGVRYDDHDDPGTRGRQDFRPAGAAVLALSLATVVGGAVALGVDRSRARRRAQVSFAPAVGGRQAGFTILGRF